MYLVHTSTYFEVKVHVGMYPVHLGTMQYMSVWYHSIDVHGMYRVHTGMYSVHTFGQDSRCGAACATAAAACATAERYDSDSRPARGAGPAVLGNHAGSGAETDSP